MVWFSGSTAKGVLTALEPLSRYRSFLACASCVPGRGLSG
jgi:hypothetical protein